MSKFNFLLLVPALMISLANVDLSADTKSFSNNNRIFVPVDGSTGPALANPFPSTINVTGFDGKKITKVTVTLNKFKHTFASDVAILLVGPHGQNVILLDQRGGTGQAVNNLDITFDDSAANFAPFDQKFPSDTSRTWKPSPSNLYNASGTPSGQSLSVFNGTNANGQWKLFVQDGAAGDRGRIAQGWTLNITADNNGCGCQNQCNSCDTCNSCQSDCNSCNQNSDCNSCNSGCNSCDNNNGCNSGCTRTVEITNDQE